MKHVLHRKIERVAEKKSCIQREMEIILIKVCSVERLKIYGGIDGKEKSEHYSVNESKWETSHGRASADFQILPSLIVVFVCMCVCLSLSGNICKFFNKMSLAISLVHIFFFYLSSLLLLLLSSFWR